MTQTKTIQAGARTQRTPGPWKVVGGTEIWAGGRIVANITRSAYGDRDRSKPNGSLIAAAPELLETVRLAHTFLDSLPHGWLAHTSGDVGALNNFYLKSRAAIAKAEGK